MNIDELNRVSPSWPVVGCVRCAAGGASEYAVVPRKFPERIMDLRMLGSARCMSFSVSS